MSDPLRSPFGLWLLRFIIVRQNDLHVVIVAIIIGLLLVIVCLDWVFVYKETTWIFVGIDVVFIALKRVLVGLGLVSVFPNFVLIGHRWCLVRHQVRDDDLDVVVIVILAINLLFSSKWGFAYLKKTKFTN